MHEKSRVPAAMKGDGKTVKLKKILLLLAIFYLIAALLPLLAFCRGSTGNEEKGEKSTEPKSSSGVSAAQTEPTGEEFRIQDADGTILTVSDEEFVRGGLAAEVPPTWETEALKAQGIALYTYYSRLREQNRAKGGDEPDFTCDTDKGLVYVPQEGRKERWGDQWEEWEKTLVTVEKSIRGLTLQSEGELVCATFFAISSGNTDSAADVWGGEADCLLPAASAGDVFASGYLSTVTMTEEEARKAIQSAFPKAELGKDPKSWLTELHRSDSGTVLSGKIGGAEATGTQIRNTFGLRSANFDWKFADGKFTFTVRGWGHNVGMSQTGAQYMAQNGASCQQILAWYYPGSELV